MLLGEIRAGHGHVHRLLADQAQCLAFVLEDEAHGRGGRRHRNRSAAIRLVAGHEGLLIGLRLRVLRSGEFNVGHVGMAVDLALAHTAVDRAGATAITNG